MEIDHERGLEQLRALLPQVNAQARHLFHLLEHRLQENLSNRRYGRDTTNTTEYNRIIDALNVFMSEDVHLSVSFIDLCRSKDEDPLDELPVELPSTLQTTLTQWQAGDRLSVQGQDYWVDEPVQRQWFAKGGVLCQQAPGRHAQSGQKVWLKQYQVSHAREAALNLKRDLEREGRLLLKLQEAGQRDFPRRLGSESTAQSAMLVYEMLAGRSLSSAFDALPKPLDNQAARRLLAGRHTLIKMLHALHTMGCSHRMLTPETLFLQSGTNRIILPDVGLAPYTVQLGEGPKLYQSPEQLRGLPAPDRATDIYQLGALFYDLLAGRHISAPVALQENGLVPELDALLRKAAAPIPKDRWPNVYAFSNALRQLGY